MKITNISLMKITNISLMFTLVSVLTLMGCSPSSTTEPTNTSVIEITSDTTWSGEMTISGQYRVNEGATLTVMAGSMIKADADVDTVIIVKQGGRIVANGTVNNPIIFTSAKIDGTRGRQDWGGIQILGRASIPGGTATAEGVDFTYGGNDDADNSGTLRYVRIEFAGKDIDSQNELNGLGLFGVGSSTTIEYVQLHNCKDDGVEPFGGTVNLSYIVATANGDDQIDCAAGWRGEINNVIAINVNGGSSIEFDGNEGSIPNSEVFVSNLLVIDNTAGSKSDGYATLWRKGGEYSVLNSLFVNNGDNLLKVDGDNTVFNSRGGITLLTSATVFSNISSGSTFNANSSDVISNSVTYPITNGTTSFSVPTSIAELDVLAKVMTFNTNVNVSWANGWTAFPAN